MSTRLPIPKLAASAVAPLRTSPRFRNELLRSGAAWPQDVNYLRDTYAEIAAAWESLREPQQDEQLFKRIEPMLRELILGLDAVAKERSSRTDIYRAVQVATYDFETASTYGRATDYAMALVYDSYALMKVHRLLEGLTLEANKKTSGKKFAYGYDTSGEVHEQGGTSGNDRHQWDTGNSPKNNRTGMNPANCMVDPEAETDYPELAAIKHKRVYWPPRTR